MSDSPRLAAAGRVTAVLGPTNTGKTYLAMDRMLGHATGMIGFPLRLLARENYDKVVRIKGARSVALITGEEKILPPEPRYFICTVESMPLDREVAFLAVDEVQLAADADRGHIFTDRILHARGTNETMLLGAETIKPLIRRLVPGAEFISRPRFSKLLYTGSKKLTRLPRRSAVVAFSASEVYGIAELIRRHRGGAAVVMGALSPRTRNAQVALYQNGDVDYMVATDAIGMGLNMDVDHVAFASMAKFDGRSPRALDAPEVAQIAGRAGRHMNEGSFGVTADAPEIDPDIIARVEAHEFTPLKQLFWRNTDVRLTSVEALLGSLRMSPPVKELMRPPPAEDQLVLEAMSRDVEVRTRITGPARVKLLWEVAQVPDFRKLKPEIHARFMTQVFVHLTGPSGKLEEDWVAGHVERVNRTDGDIHVLMDRIAAIRTWTFLAHRGDWIKDSLAWQERTRAVEDRLSDALHEKLTQQFVDSRTAHLVKRLRGHDLLTADISDAGAVDVDGHRLGQLDGLRFRAERTGLRAADRAVFNAANAALRPVLARRVEALAAAPDEAFTLEDAAIVWQGESVARLTPGADLLHPGIELMADERVEPAERRRVEDRLRAWFAALIARDLAQLIRARDAKVTSAVRGIVFHLMENLGSVQRLAVDAQVASLTKDDRTALARLGVRLGVGQVFMPALLKPAATALRAKLWCARNPGPPPAAIPPGRVTVPVIADPGFYLACGYQPMGAAAYRADMVERFAAEVRKLARDKVTLLPPALLSLVGASLDAAVPILQALGFRAKLTPEGVMFGFKRKPKPAPAEAPPAHSPFARLKELIPS